MSTIIGRAMVAGGGGGTAERLRFTYTGQYNERLDDGVVELYTGGVFTVPKDVLVDLFLVGGGGAGGRGNSAAGSNVWPGGGGGGGYTKTVNSFSLHAGTEYIVAIGSGGSSHGADGESTSFGVNSVLGGKGGYESTDINKPHSGAGGAGGSGGGGAVNGSSVIGSGGSDGSDGSTGYPVATVYGIGGKGQGTTTREFGEPTGKLYAGGGGGGRHSTSDNNQSPGGEGGGGTGSWSGSNSRTDWVAGTPGEPRTGGGGGGGVMHQTPTSSGWQDSSAAGGSGIVCIRLHKEKEGLDFTYTGDYTERKDFVVELRSSGSFTLNKDTVVDIFCVGGGGKGGDSTVEYRGGGGGGGGYTKTIRSLSLKAHTPYPVVIGAGSTQSSPVPSSEPLVHGGTTKFETLIEAIGGVSAVSSGWKGRVNGAAGGSGGGAGVYSQSTGGQGGSDGSNGENGKSYVTSEQAIGGVGQGTTTREFGEPNGKLYAGGGGGGRHMQSSTPIISPGGFGGGGAGGFCNGNGNVKQAPAAGEPNTGGGGGGTARGSSFSVWGGPPANGGSGICCIRRAVPLPELAGTWVLNARLYKADNTITQSLNFRLSSTGSADFNSILIDNDAVRVRAVGQSGYSVLYTFSTNSWGGSVPPISMTITSETASNEFCAWLVSNAIKQ